MLDQEKEEAAVKGAGEVVKKAGKRFGLNSYKDPNLVDQSRRSWKNAEVLITVMRLN